MLLKNFPTDLTVGMNIWVFQIKVWVKRQLFTLIWNTQYLKIKVASPAQFLYRLACYKNTIKKQDSKFKEERLLNLKSSKIPADKRVLHVCKKYICSS